MKYLLCVILCVVALPVDAELTDADLDKIRLIVKEEVKTEITASEKRMKEYVDIRINALDERLGARITGLEGRITGLEGRMVSIENSIDRQNSIVVACIAVPMAILAVMVAWRSLKDTSLQKQIDTLSQKLETQ